MSEEFKVSEDQMSGKYIKDGLTVELVARESKKDPLVNAYTCVDCYFWELGGVAEGCGDPNGCISKAECLPERRIDKKVIHWIEKEKSIGKLYPKGTMILRQRIGSAENNNISLEMSLANAVTPCVYCKATGKSFTISWQEIVDLAIKAGIAEE